MIELFFNVLLGLAVLMMAVVFVALFVLVWHELLGLLDEKEGE